MQDPEQLIRNTLKTGATTLDLSNLGLTQLPPSFIQLSRQLERLVLGNIRLSGIPCNAITDLSALSAFKKLRSLSVKNTALPSGFEFPFLPNLEELDASNTGLPYSTELELQLEHLRVLDLSDNNLTALKSDFKLEQLEKLVLRRNDLASLRDIWYGRFPALSSLDLGGNENIDWEEELPLSFYKLDALNLVRTGLEELSKLVQLRKLKELRLSFNPIGEPRLLAGLENLEVLSLDGTYMGILPPLGRLSGLRKLYAADNSIRDLSALRSLKGLTELDLSHNMIEDISPLEGLTNLS